MRTSSQISTGPFKWPIEINNPYLHEEGTHVITEQRRPLATDPGSRELGFGGLRIVDSFLSIEDLNELQATLK